MHFPLRKAAAFQLPPKFNFLAGRRAPPPRDWPLGHTPTEAQTIAAAASKRGAK
ncbi:hypothetical protein JOD78_003567 [Herbaspirillum sp. 1130]|nr:hypothetical protein [Herbaspirillum sp. 1130]